MSKRETRISRAWLVYYAAKENSPQRGVIMFGGGLNRKTWLDNASQAGYYVSQDRGGYVTLH